MVQDNTAFTYIKEFSKIAEGVNFPPSRARVLKTALMQFVKTACPDGMARAKFREFLDRKAAQVVKEIFARPEFDDGTSKREVEQSIAEVCDFLDFLAGPP